ncbi:MAG: hypothetical protein KKC46_20800 [Proteobacteria bacterium]|nr:hypothetical protein [Pseudomonadota bacterium]
MKYHLLWASVSLILCSFIFNFAVWGEESSHKTSYNDKPQAIKKLKKDFQDQWRDVLEKYPAVAIAYMHQEATLIALTQYRLDSTYEIKDMVAKTAFLNDSFLSNKVEAGIKFKNCIDEFIRCDYIAGSDGSYSVGEVGGCRSNFTKCWTGNTK